MHVVIQLQLAAIGYEMQTEGITFRLSDAALSYLKASPEVSARLKHNFIKHIVVTKLSALPEINYFAAEKFADVMLTVTDWMTYSNGWKLDHVINACRAGEAAFRSHFEKFSNKVYHLSVKNTEATTMLYARSDARGVFAMLMRIYISSVSRITDILGEHFCSYLKTWLKHAAQSVAGVDAMEYISAFTQLNMDFGETADRPIWIYEMGMGGVGVLRSVQDVKQRPCTILVLARTVS